MGVDVNAFCLYGAYLETDKELLIDYSDEGSFYEDDETISIPEEFLDKFNVKVIEEPYSNSWVFIGIDFLHSDTVRTIESLIHIHNEWRDFLVELCNKGIKLKFEDEPSIELEGYFD